MEPAWEKVNGSKFGLIEYEDLRGRMKPCYQLTKTECLPADIRVTGFEQAIRYAAILLDYTDESHQEFDELLVERYRYGAVWLHFAVRFRENRHKVLYINA